MHLQKHSELIVVLLQNGKQMESILGGISSLR